MDVPALRAALLGWFAVQGRDLPWRLTASDGSRDPYRVWVAEVLLQQTQVARGRVYFERFLTAFPDVQALSKAPQEAVLKAWEGCGYYARARNLHRAAGVMAASGLPQTYEGWLALPGVGPYTAAAVASLAFGEGRAVLDGNVRRVLSRLYAALQPGDAWAQETADALLDPARPGDWNEALMDLGATVCMPKGPRCGECPLAAHCRALATGEPGRYPAPKVRAAVREVRGVALLIGTAQQTYLERRGGPLLGGLWGLPLEEVQAEEDERAALERLCRRLGLHSGLQSDHLQQEGVRAEFLGLVEHTMTHRQISVSVYRAVGGGAAGLPLTPAEQRPLSRLDHKMLALDASRLTQPALF
ncbi:A/G-specific adenine glycosylase [Deinococcus sp.]|uniref:A/G-specific adenine glycosylase n=1 Tax=Deinococcus sp. TaxID=47478 RepID=UPI003C7E1B83